MMRMRIPEWIFEGEFAKVWAKWENDEETAHAQVLQVELLVNMTILHVVKLDHCLTQALPPSSTTPLL